jgi:Transposase domain (DUF772)
MKISLRDTLTQFGRMLQRQLFPLLQKEVGSLGEKHQKLVTVLAMSQMEGQLDGGRGGPGRPGHDRLILARAFVAKAVFNFPTTEALIEALGSDAVLRGICGWDSPGQVPDKSIFSRFSVSLQKASCRSECMRV